MEVEATLLCQLNLFDWQRSGIMVNDAVASNDLQCNIFRLIKKLQNNLGFFGKYFIIKILNNVIINNIIS